MQWSCKPWSALTCDELYGLLALRSEVFVVEQQCLFQDLDGLDKQDGVYHLLVMSGPKILAYARLLAPGIVDPIRVTIGRVVTAPTGRGQGLGHQLLVQALNECTLHWPNTTVYLSAQAHLQGFYQQHGFIAQGQIYLEDDIPHIAMIREVSEGLGNIA